jgi:hypothetical protein
MPVSSYIHAQTARALPLRCVLVILLGLCGGVTGQETPAPTPTPPSASMPSVARTVRISFLPPPLEGTISLGVYNEWDQLVRVLHQEARLDEFTVGADALTTKWDGKDDDDRICAAKYQAHGYLGKSEGRRQWQPNADSGGLEWEPGRSD